MSAISLFPDYSLPKLSQSINPRAMRVAILLFGVCVLNIVDLICTIFAQRMGHGLFDEMNPVADTFIRMGLTPSLICFKILMTLCGTGLLWKLRHNRLVIPGCWILLLAYVGLSVIWYVWVSDANADMEMRITNALPMDP